MFSAARDAHWAAHTPPTKTNAWLLLVGAALCGCGLVDYERVSSLASDSDDVSVTGADNADGITTRLAVCGNGIQEFDEACDEGGATASCFANCYVSQCAPGCLCEIRDERHYMACANAPSFSEAQALCQSVGMQLAEPRDSATNNHLSELAALTGTSHSGIYLGFWSPQPGVFRRLSDNALVWNDKTVPHNDGLTPEYSAFGDTPNLAASAHGCLVLKTAIDINPPAIQGLWEDYECDSARAVVCERGTLAPSLVLEPPAYATDQVTLRWNAPAQQSTLLGYRVLVSGAATDSIDLPPELNEYTWTAPTGAIGAARISVRALTEAGLGSAGADVILPLSDTIARVYFEDGVLQRDGMDLYAHDYAASIGGYDVVAQDPDTGEDDARRHYISLRLPIGLIEDAQSVAEARSMQLGVRATFYDNTNDSFYLQFFNSNGASYNRSSTNTLRTFTWRVGEDDVINKSQAGGNLRFTATTWAPSEPGWLYMHEAAIVLLPAQ